MDRLSYAQRLLALARLMTRFDERQMLLLLFCAGESSVEALLEAVDLLQFGEEV